MQEWLDTSESLSNHYTNTMPIDDIALTLRSIPTSTPSIHERGVYTKYEEQNLTGDRSHIQRTDKTSTTTNTILNPRRTKYTQTRILRDNPSPKAYDCYRYDRPRIHVIHMILYHIDVAPLHHYPEQRLHYHYGVTDCHKM